MKIAYFSPMPPEPSGIADYSALVLPALRERLDVNVVKRGTKRPPRGTDLSVYHIGNNPDAHGWILDALRRHSGAVVLHDFVLHHLVAGVTIGRRDGHGYLDAMEREHGVVGRLLAHGVLDKRLPPLWEARPEEFPLAGEVLSLASGLVVHSRYVADRARAAGFAGPISRVAHPAWPDPRVEPAAIAGDPLIGAFGNVNQSKRVPQLLEAFARVRADHPGARLLLVGATSPGFDLERRLQRLGLGGDGIVREGYVDERRLWELMAACDVHVSLRSPTMGETSGTAIRALTLGKPLVVSDVGWFAELPDGVALRVAVGDGEVADLAAALRLLAERPDARAAMGAAAQALAASEHDLGRVADLQASAFERIAGGGAVAGGGGRGGGDGAGGGGRAPRVPDGAWLAGIVVASAALRVWLVRAMPAPFIFVDELIYSELAKSVADAGSFAVRGVSTSGYSTLYPLLLAPAYALFDALPSAYALAKTTNSVAMSLAAIPAWLVTRRVAGRGLSLLCAVIAVAIPSMAYTATLVTETLFYPVALLFAWTFLRVLERPSGGRIAVLAAALVAALATRSQAIGFVGAILLAPFLLALLRRDAGVLRRFAPLLGGTVGLGLLVVVAQLARGRSLSDLLGAYSVVGQGGYDAGYVLRYWLWHVEELTLYVSVLPVVALVVLLWQARGLPARVQEHLAATLAMVATSTLVVGAFASRFASDRVQDRYLFFLAPLLVAVLAAWVELGAPRPRVPLLVGAVIAIGLVVVFPYVRFIGEPAKSDTFGLLPLWTANAHLLAGSYWATVLAVALGLVALLAFVPARRAAVVPIVLLGLFVVLSRPVWSGPHGVLRSGEGALFQGIRGAPRDWIDDSVPPGDEVAVLWTGRADRFTVNQNEFFNRRVGRVYYTSQPTPGGIGETPVRIDADGVVRTPNGGTVNAPYALLDGSVTPDGRVVARDDLGTTLWRLRGPLSSLTSVSGLYPNDTWSGARVTWRRLRCMGGQLLVGLHSDPTLFAGQLSRVTALVRGKPVASIAVAPEGTATLRVPLEAEDGTCVVRFTVSPTRVPAEVIPGNTDDRELGAHFDSFVQEEPA